MLNLKNVNSSRYKSPSVLQQWNNCLQTQVQQTDRQTGRDLERGGAEDRQTLALHYQQFEGGCRTLGQFLPASFLLLWFSRNSRRGVCVCRCVMTLKVCMCLQAQRCRVEQSRVISLQRKARICTAAGTKSERVRERVTNRQRERAREWDRSVFLYVWGCCQHAAGYWSKTIGGDVSEKAGLSEYEARSLVWL